MKLMYYCVLVEFIENIIICFVIFVFFFKQKTAYEI